MSPKTYICKKIDGFLQNHIDMMKIIIDSAIPYIKGVFEPYAEVEYIAGSNFTAQIVRNADALIIRTRTKCNEALLSGSSVRHIATATIGFDHIDTEYCSRNNISVSTAAGCNARAVLQWMGAALALLARREEWQPKERTLGVVGVGNVGSLVSRYAESWGFRVICCDPPRAEREHLDFCSMEQIAQQADIITLHTPLDGTTRSMINNELLKLCKPHATIINTSRGEVVVTSDLVCSGRNYMLDVWEDEPAINREVLSGAIVATPHIAGYSIEGKRNATVAAVHSIASALALPLENWEAPIAGSQPKDISWQELLATIDSQFDIEDLSCDLKLHPEEFERMRNNYQLRKESF